MSFTAFCSGFGAMKLTGDEIKLVVFVLVALLVGASAKYYRLSHPPILPPTPPGKHRSTTQPW